MTHRTMSERSSHRAHDKETQIYFNRNHSIYREGRKEGNVLFNDALNSVYLQWCQGCGKGPLRD